MRSDIDLTYQEIDTIKKGFKIPTKGKRLERYLLRVALDKEMVPYHRFNGVKPDWLWWKCRLIIQSIHDQRKIKDRVPGTIPRFQYEEDEVGIIPHGAEAGSTGSIHSKRYCPVCLKLMDLSTDFCPECGIPMLRTWDYGGGYTIRGGVS